MVPILINKDVFDPSYNDLRLAIWKHDYFCTNVGYFCIYSIVKQVSIPLHTIPLYNKIFQLNMKEKQFSVYFFFFFFFWYGHFYFKVLIVNITSVLCFGFLATRHEAS